MFSRGLEATVAHLRAHGLRVVILGGVPEIGWDVPSLLASRRRLGIPLPPLPTLEEVKGRHAAADRILAQIVERQGAELIPLAPCCAGRPARSWTATARPMPTTTTWPSMAAAGWWGRCRSNR